MPYTAALLASIPHLDRAARAGTARLQSIPGTVPDALAPIVGCAFEARCRYASDLCRRDEPALERTADARAMRCHYWRDLDLAPPAPRLPAAAAEPPAPGAPEDSPPADDLLRVEGLMKAFPLRGGLFQRVVGSVAAVRGVSFEIRRGEVFGLVGESGSGKTTLGRSIVRLVEPTAGRVVFDGRDLTAVPAGALKRLRREMQVIFQDPYGSLNPRMTVEEILSEPFTIHRLAQGAERAELVARLLEQVGLSPDHAGRFPHEFSGGQRQRIAIARALAVEPSFLVADEPVSALDVSVQAQVLNLLWDLTTDLGLTMLFIAHDLSVVAYLADRVAVMYLGRIVEIGPTRSIYANPVHPYTEALLSAVPVADPAARRRRILLEGDIPSPLEPPSGCVFPTRCPIAAAECAQVVPPLEPVAPGHLKACIRR